MSRQFFAHDRALLPVPSPSRLFSFLTGNIDRDEIFYPVRRAEMETPFVLAQRGYFGLGLSWWLYLLLGYRPRAKGSHFSPFNPMHREHAVGVSLSLLSWLAWMSFVVWWTWTHDAVALVAVLYVAPLFVFGCWLVVVTFLHHQAPLSDAAAQGQAATGRILWRSDSVWNRVAGATAACDRDYGTPLQQLTHHIGLHQVHHLFATIPHYHLVEATRAFRVAYPQLVCERERQRILPAFLHAFDVFARQHYHLDDDVDVFEFGPGVLQRRAGSQARLTRVD